MNIVDSSGWLEYFADGKNADFFAPAIENTPELIVPVISVYEVFKRISQQRTEHEALQAVAVMVRGSVIEMDVTLALHSARVSVESRLPMADSIMLAVSRDYGAVLWTQDSDFKDLEGVRYIEKGQS